MHRVAPSCRRSPSTSRRAFAALLAVALVPVQMLGLAHRVVHAERAQEAATAFAASADAPEALEGSAQRTGAGWLPALFAGHDPGVDCDAFDQTSHADLVVDMSPGAALPPSGGEACRRHAAWHVAAQARGFLASAPPPAA